MFNLAVCTGSFITFSTSKQKLRVPLVREDALIVHDKGKIKQTLSIHKKSGNPKKVVKYLERSTKSTTNDTSNKWNKKRLMVSTPLNTR